MRYFFQILIIVFLSSNAFAWEGLVKGILGQAIENQEQNRIIKQALGDDKNYEIFVQFSLCINAVEQDSQFNALNIKAPVPSKIKFSNRIDDTYANGDEKKLIRIFVGNIEECIDEYMNYNFDPAPAELFAISNLNWTETINDLAYVYEGKMTWGQYNTMALTRAGNIKQAYATWEKNLLTKIYNANEIRKLKKALQLSNQKRNQIGNDKFLFNKDKNKN